MHLILGAEDNQLPRDIILINDGFGNFSPATNALPERYGGLTWGTVDIHVLDVNNDGYPDLLMSTFHGYTACHLQLLINNRDGTFRDATQNIPQNWPKPTAEHIWITRIESGDFNNDGLIDFVVNVNGRRPKLFLNAGDG